MKLTAETAASKLAKPTLVMANSSTEPPMVSVMLTVPSVLKTMSANTVEAPVTPATLMLPEPLWPRVSVEPELSTVARPVVMVPEPAPSVALAVAWKAGRLMLLLTARRVPATFVVPLERVTPPAKVVMSAASLPSVTEPVLPSVAALFTVKAPEFTTRL